MKKYTVAVILVFVLVVFLAFSNELVLADESGPEDEGQKDDSIKAGEVLNIIPIQGKLTDASGRPLNGEFVVAFRLYDVLSGGTQLCIDTNTVTVVNGLFTSEIWGNCPNQINGRQLYLGIEVEGNGEMVPREPIYAIPYAWSLRPGATIIGTINTDAIVDIENWSTDGRGLRSYAMSETGTNYGVVGASASPAGYGGYFYNNNGGVGLLAASDIGSAAIKADGAIQSTALSYVWISGNNVRPYHQSDSTIIDMDTVGGAKITRGATVGNKNVMLPITITSPLYGQDVTVVGMDIYYVGSSEFDGITAILMRRQTGVCSSESCYATIRSDGTDLSCQSADNPEGCSYHWDFTTNNILNADSGILYLTIELAFSSSTGWVDIGGVRLTLAHD